MRPRFDAARVTAKVLYLFIAAFLIFSAGLMTSTRAQTVRVDSRSSTTDFDQFSLSSPITWEHTVGSDNNRLLIVAVSTSNVSPVAVPADRVTGVTYGGTPMTRVGSKVSPDTLSMIEMFQLVAPSSGTALISVELIPSVNYVVGGAVSFAEVSQSTPISASQFVADSAGTPQLSITSPVGGLVIDAIAINDKALFVAPGNDQVEQWNGSSGFSDAFSIGAGSIKSGTGSVLTLWAVTFQEPWALGAASLKPCTFTLSSSLPPTFTSAGGTGSISVQAADPNCTWTATSANDWITITSSNTGMGNGTITYSVAPTNIAQRSGSIDVSGVTFDITQESNVTVELSLSPSSVFSGLPSTATLTLSNPAPSGGATVTLSSSNTAIATVPASVVVPASATTTTFTVTTKTVASTVSVDLTATYLTRSSQATLEVKAPELHYYTQSTTIANSPCQSVRGRVHLKGKAPAGGVVINLSSTNSAATVPPTLTIAAGQTYSALFAITLSNVTSTQVGQITASYGGQSLSRLLYVTPINVKSLTLAPSPVAGPGAVTGTITLTCPAPAGGLTITLESSFRPIARPTVSSIKIPEGQTMGTFGVETADILEPYRLYITATANGIRKVVHITVN